MDTLASLSRKSAANSDISGKLQIVWFLEFLNANCALASLGRVCLSAEYKIRMKITFSLVGPAILFEELVLNINPI